MAPGTLTKCLLGPRKCLQGGQALVQPQDARLSGKSAPPCGGSQSAPGPGSLECSLPWTHDGLGRDEFSRLLTDYSTAGVVGGACYGHCRIVVLVAAARISQRP